MPVPGRTLAVFVGTSEALLSSTRFSRKTVQRASRVVRTSGAGERLAPASQVPSCGGGGSLWEELKLTPTSFARKSVGRREPDQVVLGDRLLDPGVAVTAGADIEAGVVEAGGVDMIEPTPDRSGRPETVAAEQTRVVGGQVAAPPAAHAAPEHLSAATVVVGRAAVEVADGQVLDPDLVSLDRDSVPDPVAAVDDDPVAVEAAQMQIRGADRDRARVDARGDQDPVARPRLHERCLGRAPCG